MGRVAGVFLSEKAVKTVLLKGGRWGYTLEGTGEGLPTRRKLSGYRVHLAYLYTDLITETVRIPPVKDEETRTILLRKQLAERVGSPEDLLIVYREVESGPEERSYRIFGVPAHLYWENPLIPGWLRESLALFTLPQLALAAVSAQLYPELTVFHVYVDESALLMVVSRAGEVVYTRSLPLPSYAEDDLDAFLHENVSMTFLFVVQRQGISVDVVLLSGRARREKLAESLLRSAPAGLAVPLVPPVFRDVSPETFHSFLPAFGAALTGEEYDLSPPEIRGRRKVEGYVGKGLVLIALLLLVCVGGIAYRTYLIAQEVKALRELNTTILQRTEDLLRDPLVRDSALNYYLSYANLISEVRRRNPLKLLPLSADLITGEGVRRVALVRREDRILLLLEIEKRFPRLVELALFREELTRKLKELEKEGISYRVEREESDLGENRLRIDLRLERSL